ncbi:GIG1 family protein [Aspergillus novofumigatus IBT 16806]|uniref:N-acetylglucosamine-induced protein 1 n=1 Tax=Aspergillus novofumigatus (strain IBT 16806) TaxID=1392255 RepID=A0A2I1BYQ8_ASPN1|nr:uncharacterized protein P174DRAFT_413392 [Aspergillus novofumigatus IBT 16806]PKX90510.1 hypothetical protein P174DRAFT_413392 [Aspergillus novofumigatus IBT 16806]
MGSATQIPNREKDEEIPDWNLTEVDRMLLRQTDEEYEPHSWDELKWIIQENRLELFKRLPSHLRRYINWSKGIKERYGGTLNYICQERLSWDVQDSKVVSRNPIPLASPSDYCIRFNDWPYGVAPGIRHLVVWLKTPFPLQEDGSLASESRARIETFVSATFAQRLAREDHADAPEDRVLWFKNWAALQSVSALEHFHVMVRDASEQALGEWIGADNMVTICDVSK